MTNLEALVSLNLVLDIGSIRLKKLLEFFDTPENILKAQPEKLVMVSGIGEKIAHQVHSLKKEDLDRELSLAKKHNLKIITLDDSDYPENLRNITDPPIVLYVKGELKKEDKYSIAIVGSRRASFYGLENAQNFSSSLSEKGFTIISGMARGIDSSAHKGALKRGGRTIAVIGSGFSHIYPPENQELAKDISHSGAVISELPMEALPLKQNFPRRNRVISGLSLGVLVVEAARNSGALITADFALEQGREVFALPGKVDSRTSFGTNGLIKQGAKLVSCVEDIIEEFDTFAASKPHPSGCGKDTPLSITLKTNPGLQTGDSRRVDVPTMIKPEASNITEPDLPCQESVLYGLIPKQEPMPLDEIVERANMSIPSISNILLQLQMKKLIRQLPGKQFIRN